MTFTHIPAARIETMNRPRLIDAISLAWFEEWRRDGLPIDRVPGVRMFCKAGLHVVLLGAPRETVLHIALRSWKDLE